MPSALITGITGQDGSYLAELLLQKGYEVHGVVRRTSHHSFERIEHLLDRVHIAHADLLDQHSLTVVMQEIRPDEVYNLAAQSWSLAARLSPSRRRQSGPVGSRAIPRRLGDRAIAPTSPGSPRPAS